MSMSDCPKCLETPCTCGFMYEEWDISRLKEHINMLNYILSKKLNTITNIGDHKIYSQDNNEMKITNLGYESKNINNVGLLI